jgi:hypothetical protein
VAIRLPAGANRRGADDVPAAILPGASPFPGPAQFPCRGYEAAAMHSPMVTRGASDICPAIAGGRSGNARQTSALLSSNVKPDTSGFAIVAVHGASHGGVRPVYLGGQAVPRRSISRVIGCTSHRRLWLWLSPPSVPTGTCCGMEQRAVRSAEGGERQRTIGAPVRTRSGSSRGPQYGAAAGSS